MDATLELVFFLVFFVPMAILVTLNLLLHRAPPDITAPWARLAAPQPQPFREEARAEAPVASVCNEEEALAAA